MTVRDFLQAAQNLAFQQYPTEHQRWVSLSFRLGGLIPNSLLMVEIQRCGRTDLISRALEDGVVEGLRAGGNVGFDADLNSSFSESWIGKAYSILYILDSRKITRDQTNFRELLNDLRLLRVSLEKFEIASDRRISDEGLLFQRVGGGPESSYVYDPTDSRRGHIMPSRLDSATGSIEWAAIDGANVTERWIGRRSLSDRMLALEDDLLPALV